MIINEEKSEGQFDRIVKQDIQIPVGMDPLIKINKKNKYRDLLYLQCKQGGESFSEELSMINQALSELSNLYEDWKHHEAMIHMRHFTYVNMIISIAFGFITMLFYFIMWGYSKSGDYNKYLSILVILLSIIIYNFVTITPRLHLISAFWPKTSNLLSEIDSAIIGLQAELVYITSTTLSLTLNDISNLFDNQTKHFLLSSISRHPNAISIFVTGNFFKLAWVNQNINFKDGTKVDFDGSPTPIRVPYKSFRLFYIRELIMWLIWVCILGHAMIFLIVDSIITIDSILVATYIAILINILIKLSTIDDDLQPVYMDTNKSRSLLICVLNKIKSKVKSEIDVIGDMKNETSGDNEKI